MATTAVFVCSEEVSVEEYLHSAYEPDRELVDGRLEERNVGEFDHGYLQILLGTLFPNNRQAWECLR